jgi:sugar lactone lactonase YvrE
LILLGIGLIPRFALAVELAPGDIVLFSESTCGIYRLDPATLAPTQISGCLGFGGEAHHIVVDRRGRLLVTDEARGIVEVSPATGERSAFVSVEALGGPPRGIAFEGDGNILVSVQTSPPRLLRIDVDTRGLTVITEGGLLIGPTGVGVAPGGAILVADQSTPTIGPIPNVLSIGALIRVDAATGQQSRIAADPLYRAPQDVAYVGGDSVWVVNRGLTLRTAGAGLTVTRLSNGATSEAPVGFFGSEGVALLPDGRIAFSGCMAVHGDCSFPYVAIYGSVVSLGGYMGALAVVPEREAPKSTLLAPALPNPFGKSTALGFTLAKPGTVELAVYSVDGRRIVTLASGPATAGYHAVTWDGTDARGRRLGPGVYYARLMSAEGKSSRTLVLVR